MSKSNTIVVLGLRVSGTQRTVRLIAIRPDGVKIAWNRGGETHTCLWKGPWRRHGETQFHTPNPSHVVLSH